LLRIESKGKVSADDLNEYIESHWIDVASIRSDDFDNHIIYRAKILLSAIEGAIGKVISGKDSEEVIEVFGKPLI
ncbi:MAG: hypothetical protein II782_00770, partial [Oscillospiraceae bacterium]|nr:hypothetical protein [Oscillospiraceae bacterium]